MESHFSAEHHELERQLGAYQNPTFAIERRLHDRWLSPSYHQRACAPMAPRLQRIVVVPSDCDPDAWAERMCGALAVILQQSRRK
jgi:hypothetical protein